MPRRSSGRPSCPFPRGSGRPATRSECRATRPWCGSSCRRPPRVSVPPLSNTFISLVKDTSLASLILVTELFREAQQVAAFSQEFMLLYLEAAVIYWIICLVLASGQSALEKRLDRYVAH